LPGTKRFWNGKLIGVEMVVTALGGTAFLIWLRNSQEWRAWWWDCSAWGLLTREYGGIAVNAQMISLPTGRLCALPFIYRERRKIHPASVRELTVTRPWYTFQIAHIQGDFGSEVLMFPSRGERLRFMKVIERICPNVQMYRKMPPSIPSP
jgi:hypothetical protein